MKRRFSLIIMLMAAVTLAFAGNNDDELNVTLWQTPDKPSVITAPSHRIPALVKCSDGSLLAMADWRLHLSDIGGTGTEGVSQIEIRYRKSYDSGQTWTEQGTICSRNTTDQNDWKWAMGDAALVADSESGNVLMMCAAGNVGIGASTAEKPLRIGCFRSTDNGQTWDEGEEITSQIYGLYGGEATALFITSGSMFQSKTVKVGNYYRIYAAFPIRTSQHGNGTGVIYSDDFGKSWQLLGWQNGFAEGLVYEEGKVAELPDGSIVLMVRDDSGAQSVGKGKKNFCRFVFDNVATGSGSWTKAVSGITGMANACNNALIIVPAINTSNNQPVDIALVALPFHTNNSRDAINNYGRKNVGFVYKVLTDENDYSDGSALANGWQRGLQITNKCSAYTDLMLTDNSQIAILFEDNGKQGRGVDGNNETEAYDIVYRTFNLETITNGEYSVRKNLNPNSIKLNGTAKTVANKLYDISGRPFSGNSTIAASKEKKAVFRRY